jgi:hypothetical protein
MAARSRLLQRSVCVNGPAMFDHPLQSVTPPKEVYRELVSKAVEALIAEGYLLPGDLDEMVQRAVWRYDLFSASG